MPKHPRLHAFLDRIGATGSLLCAVHCALLPVAIAALPALGVGLLADHRVEVGFIAFATVLGASSLVLGWWRHRHIAALRLLLPGLGLLWLGVLFPWLHDNRVLHALVMTAGGALVGLAHVRNLRLNHCALHGAGCVH
jgi:hypothetical protein